MRGRLHTLKLVGQRLISGPDAGEVQRDSEGRWVQSPTIPAMAVDVREVTGRIGFPNRSEIPEGETVDAAAHLPLGTVVKRGDELLAAGTGNAALDDRYEVIGVGYGRVMVRVLLRKFKV